MEDRGKKGKKLLRKGKVRPAGPAEEEEAAMGKPRPDASPSGSRDGASLAPRETPRRKRPGKERWLLTRKTWRYMADAGRRLIPEGAHNRPEDVPKIEAYFQEVCQKEPRFLLWRKSSYPGALGFRSHRRKDRRKKGGSCREKASSADEAEELRAGAMFLEPKPGGRFDLHRMRKDFLFGPDVTDTGPTSTDRPVQGLSRPGDEEQERKWFIDTLCRYLGREEAAEAAEAKGGARAAAEARVGPELQPVDYQMLVEQLRKYMSSMSLTSDSEEGGMSAGSSSSLHQEGAAATARGGSFFGSSTAMASFQRTLASGSGGFGRSGLRPSSMPSPSSSPPFPRPSVHFRGDPQQQKLLDTLQRYYSKSTSRQKVISDLLTDRKLLEKLYFDLRKTRGFGGRKGAGTSDPETAGLDYQLRRREAAAAAERGKDSGSSKGPQRPKDIPIGPPGRTFRHQHPGFASPPPLIEIDDEGEGLADAGTQTPPVTPEVLAAIEDALQQRREREAAEAGPSKEESDAIKDRSGGLRRRSSVDHDDVSPSVSDTIKRYLRMARKKSLDSDKADRFKRVNYDRNLRNIKAKGEITKPGDDDGLNKGAQTEWAWVDAMREANVPDVAELDVESRGPSSRSSFDEGSLGLLSPPASAPHGARGLLASGQTFLAGLLHGLQHAAAAAAGGELPSGAPAAGSPLSSAAVAAAAAMQKSKSSTSVVQHGSRVAKKLWRGARSKSQGRAVPAQPCTWTPQGKCTWSSVAGGSVVLGERPLLTLTELERRVLVKVALAKLQALNLGVTVRVPSESVNGGAGAAVQKPKRRAYLLKRKAITTSIFDTARKDADKEKGAEGGMVFGIPLSQCLENDRVASGEAGAAAGTGAAALAAAEALRRQSRHGSSASFTSLIEIARPEESGSCESLATAASGAGAPGSGPRAAGSVPGLLDALSSCGSAPELLAGDGEPPAPPPAVPRLVAACFRHLERFGLDTLGLFRVSTSKKRVRQLREEFDTGKEVVLGEEHCPHDVATLLKEFFRDLPEPLLSRDLYHAFVQTQKIRNRRLQLEALQHLVQLLPPPNRDTLHALLAFLSSVAAHAPDHRDPTGEWVSGNKMDSSNLATVFAPNVLHCVKPGDAGKQLNAERAEDRMDVINVMRAMIDHYKDIFMVTPELMDEVYVHMMDSHPEALDRLLRIRYMQTDEYADDLESGSEVVSPVTSPAGTPLGTPMSTPMGTPLGTPMGTPMGTPAATPVEAEGATVRRVWSREEFLHETAAMGGPDLGMRPTRHRERVRERPTRKRWSEDGGGSGGGGAPGAAGSGRRRATDPETRLGAESPTPPDPGVITASLKIPVPGAALSLEDVPGDIPFIEEGPDAARQQLTFGPGGLVRSGSGAAGAAGAGQRRRQRTVSAGSDSCGGGGAGASAGATDSAVGSSTTPFSSPQRNTPSLAGSGSGSDAGLCSSPPSWASSPPTSPDAAALHFPEDVSSARLSFSTKAATAAGTKGPLTAKELAPVILQKVTFTSTSELKQVKQVQHVQQVQTSTHVGVEQETASRVSKDVRARRTQDAPDVAPTAVQKLSTPASTFSPSEITVERHGDRKLTTSISSIGGAVMRSKTADIERMLRIQKSAAAAAKVEVAPSPAPAEKSSEAEKKKYTKRRYTDSRHQTKHIPDAETLQAGAGSTAGSEPGTAATRGLRQGGVWKRRELIASDPKRHGAT